MSLNINTRAPSFKLPDQSGTGHTLENYKGKWIVLYFYPKDDTPGCTKEACGFRDSYAVFKENGTVVLGVSKDSSKSHSKFIQKYDLPFTLLSDESKEMIKTYEAWGKKKFMGREFEGVLRITYLIDPEGKIRKVYENVKPDAHAQEILQDIKSLSE